jgi:hypothetical protein
MRNWVRGKSRREIQYHLEKTAHTKSVKLHDDHGLRSRRDFLASGLLTFSGTLVTPSILQILASSRAHGASGVDCADGGLSRLPAFVTINLSGGAALSGNLIPLSAPGVGLANVPTANGAGANNMTRGSIGNYSIQGLGQASDNPFSNAAARILGNSTDAALRFKNGALFSASNTPATDTTAQIGLFRGILAGVAMGNQQANIMARTNVFGICVRSTDDNSDNKMDASGLIMRAGLRGEYLGNLGSSGNKPTGVRQDFALVAPPSALVVGNNVQNIVNAVSTTGALREALAPAGAAGDAVRNQRLSSLFRLVNGLSASQGQALAQASSSSSAETVRDLVTCATGKNIPLATQLPDVNPLNGTNPQTAALRTATQSIFQTTANAAADTATGQNLPTRQAMGAMVYNAVLGNASAVGFDLGGYDYHGQPTRAATDLDDYQAGQIIGRTLALAHAAGSKLMIHVTSDGSVDGPANSAFGADYLSDFGLNGMSYIITYDPSNVATMKNDRFGYQIGHFSTSATAGTAAATTGSVVGTLDRAALAVLANYAALHDPSLASVRKMIQTAAGLSLSSTEEEEMLRLQTG